MNETHPMMLKFEIIFWKISIIVINYLIKTRSILENSRQWVCQSSKQYPIVVSLVYGLIGLFLGLIARLLIPGE